MISKIICGFDLEHPSERNHIKTGPQYGLSRHLISPRDESLEVSIRVRSCLVLFFPADEATGSRCWGNFSLASFGILSEPSNKLFIYGLGPRLSTTLVETSKHSRPQHTWELGPFP